MSKIELNETNSGYNLQKINSNFQKIEEEFNDKVLYRDNPNGEPNEMLNDLDMNGNRVYNLPVPAQEHEAARLKDVQNAIADSAQANLIEFAPYGTITATNVQGAIQELEDGKLTKADLASTDAGKGAEMVGYKSPHVGSVALTQAEFNDLQTVVPQMFGAKADGITDDTAAVQAAIDSGSYHIHFPAGHYVLQNLTCDRDIKITGDGRMTVLDWSATGGSGLTISGSYVALPALSSSVGVHANSISFVSAPDVAFRDVICLYNPDGTSWLPSRDYYSDGEFFRVSSVSGNVVNIFGRASSPYSSATFDAYKINGVSVDVSDIRIIPSTAAGITVDMGVDVSFSNVMADKGPYAGYAFHRCFNVNVIAPRVLNSSPVVGNQYGFAISNSHQVTVTGGGAAATRHAIALGGAPGVCCVPTRNVIIHGMVLENMGSDIGAADMHGNVDNVQYDNCIIRNAAHAQGRNVSYRNCKIYGMLGTGTSGWCVYGTEIAGGTYVFENCEFVTYGDLNAIGCIYISPDNGMRDDLHVIVRNCTMTGAGSGGPNAKFVYLRGRNANRKMNCLIDGVNVISTQLFAFLLAREEADSSTPILSDYLIVDNVRGPAGAYLIQPVGAISNIYTKEMAQRGRANITTTANQVVAPQEQSFRYKYSRIPSAVVGVSLLDGTSSGLTAGQPASPKIYSITNEAIRCAITAPAAFTAGTQVSLHWSVGVN